MSWKKKIIWLIILTILVIIGVSVYKHFKAESKKITGEERFLYEMKFMAQMQDLAEQLDINVILYYKGDIDTEAYLTQMKMIDDEFELFKTQYNYFDFVTEVKIGTHTLASKKGLDAAIRTYNLMHELILSCENEEYYMDKDKLIYMYIAKNKQIKTELATYSECMTAEQYKWYQDHKEHYDKLMEEKAKEASSTDAFENIDNITEEGD